MAAQHVAGPAIGAAGRIDADMNQAKLGQLPQVAITQLLEMVATQLGAYIHDRRPRAYDFCQSCMKDSAMLQVGTDGRGYFVRKQRACRYRRMTSCRSFAVDVNVV
jgi:hypothetical protein